MYMYITRRHIGREIRGCRADVGQTDRKIRPRVGTGGVAAGGFGAAGTAAWQES